ncbi:phage holin family protein [Parapedobacter sp. ISTM3]|uniref:Putative membrane protein n=2 Tax=Sphingobacteriaceae TaxID=84566 RepID=A0A1T4ZTS7_9SPHI|nr:phage holin family protein [Parapedobacter sp. ISTM3]MBK1438570.1 phage holin family protein [Parapedobacter sp. ISTM3]SKB25723.1 putative membrane protein [Parapedobacter luteus]
MRFIINILLTGLAIFLAALILPESAVRIAGFGWAILAGLIIGFVNATIGTMLRIFTLPLNLLTLGLISFIITVLMVQLTSYFMGSKFDVANFWWAAVFAIIVALIELLFNSIFGSKDSD